MYQVGEKIVYRRDVCEIVDIKKKYFHDLDYYILRPINDSSLKIQIPITSENLRPLISQVKIEELLREIPAIEEIESSDRLIDAQYRALMQQGTHEDLIKIIKTTYTRNQKRIAEKKKISDRDNDYLKQAEKYLYTELSVVLDLSLEETKQYVIKKVASLEKKA